jgi:Ca2+/Na+ antiporter
MSNKKLTKKQYFRMWIFPALVCYIIFTFIQWDFNPANWHIIIRFFCFALYIFLICAVAYSIKKNEK